MHSAPLTGAAVRMIAARLHGEDGRAKSLPQLVPLRKSRPSQTDVGRDLRKNPVGKAPTPSSASAAAVRLAKHRRVNGGFATRPEQTAPGRLSAPLLRGVRTRPAAIAVRPGLTGFHHRATEVVAV